MNKDEQRIDIPGVSVKLIFPDDGSGNEAFLDVLQEQNVECSDWDYMLVFDNTDDLFRPVYDEYYENRVEPVDCYTIERLLTGCCDNIFLQVWINGEPMVVGMAYH